MRAPWASCAAFLDAALLLLDDAARRWAAPPTCFCCCCGPRVAFRARRHEEQAHCEVADDDCWNVLRSDVAIVRGKTFMLGLAGRIYV